MSVREVEALPLVGLLDAVDERTRGRIQHRRTGAVVHRRGWLVRRMLLLADLVGLLVAFAITFWLFRGESDADRVKPMAELLLFVATLPGWILLAKLQGLYDGDEERADNTTVDDLGGVFHIVTAGTWLFWAGSWVTGLAEPSPWKLVTFWALAIGSVTVGRAVGRASARHSVTYLQNTVIVGAGDIGQLAARKVLQHPEYGINLVGFVDASPKRLRADLGHLALLGSPEQLPEIIPLLDVERVIIAFSNERDDTTMEVVRALRDADVDVQVDIVPRLFELVGPRVAVHTLEGLPLVGLPPARLTPSSRWLKRGLDVAVSGLLLLLTAPVFAFIAWRIKREGDGPVFFRQTRLGINMREFEALKFRTMKVDTDDSAHRAYMKSLMSVTAEVGSNGIYKLDRSDAITHAGRWLRKTSLDELPQLINVFRGDMSLVGPRPCLAYETESFEPHHFERFMMPAGLTGLWQVTARAHSTFVEALEMDVSYVRGWSLGLDLRLLCRTPFQVLRQTAGTK